MKKFGLFVGNVFFGGRPLNFKRDDGCMDGWRLNMSGLIINRVETINCEMIAKTGGVRIFFYGGV
jgi:hypothetical protein